MAWFVVEERLGKDTQHFHAKNGSMSDKCVRQGSS